MPKYNLVINERFRLWPHPNRDELKEAIRKAGRIFEAIDIMAGDQIVDGITRYEIAKELKLDFDVLKHDFKDEDEAELWAREKQGSRRNLNRQQSEENIHAMMKLAKKPHGSNLPKVPLKRKNCALDETPGKTAKQVAKAVGKSPRTVELIEKRQDIIQSLPKAIQLHYKKTGEKLTDAQWKTLDTYDNIGEVATQLSGKRAPDIKTAYKQVTGKALTGTKSKAVKPKPTKPPKKLDRNAYYKQWDAAIGPLVRLVDKIANGVGESRNGHHKKVQTHLNDATTAMQSWLGVK